MAANIPPLFSLRGLNYPCSSIPAPRGRERSRLPAWSLRRRSRFQVLPPPQGLAFFYERECLTVRAQRVPGHGVVVALEYDSQPVLSCGEKRSLLPLGLKDQAACAKAGLSAQQTRDPPLETKHDQHGQSETHLRDGPALLLYRLGEQANPFRVIERCSGYRGRSVGHGEPFWERLCAGECAAMLAE